MMKTIRTGSFIEAAPDVKKEEPSLTVPTPSNKTCADHKTEPAIDFGKKTCAPVDETAVRRPTEFFKADAVSPCDRNSDSGIHPTPVDSITRGDDSGRKTMVACADSRVLIWTAKGAHCHAFLLDPAEAVTHGRDVLEVGLCGLREQSPVMAERAARDAAARCLALADAIGVAAMTPADIAAETVLRR